MPVLACAGGCRERCITGVSDEPCKASVIEVLTEPRTLDKGRSGCWLSDASSRVKRGTAVRHHWQAHAAAQDLELT